MNASRTNELARALLEMTDGVGEAAEKKAVTDFAAYLDKKGMLKKAPAIMAEYQRLYDKRHEIVSATVSLSSRLSDAELSGLKDALKTKYSAKDVSIEQIVDQRLLGGIKIKVGDEVYDSSLKNSLDQLQAQLLK